MTNTSDNIYFDDAIRPKESNESFNFSEKSHQIKKIKHLKIIKNAENVFNFPVS